MSDLISRQETLYILANLNSAWVGYEKVSRLPTIDAVPVVRCKDCKFNYANQIPSEDVCQLCVELPITGDFFCKWGERKEE